MTRDELKKKIYDTVEPMLDGQGIIKFQVDEPDKSKCFELIWRDSITTKVFAVCTLSHVEDEVIEYCIVNRFHKDIIDAKFDHISTYYASVSDSHYCLYSFWAGVEITLQTFTEWLVKTVHGM